jgi:quercetin dioxygenase-like cupin family protein
VLSIAPKGTADKCRHLGVTFAALSIIVIVNDQDQLFSKDAAMEWEIVGEGVKRKIMAYDDRIMLVKVSFDKGSVGAQHYHPHAQVTHVESGTFEVEISGTKQVLHTGDAFIIPGNAVHGVVCLEAGVLIDVFTPIREDFLPT